MNKFVNMNFKSFKEIDGGKEYKAVVYTNLIDREGEMAVNEFLDEMSSLIVDKPLTKDHDWENVDKIVGRVTEAHVIDCDDYKAVEVNIVVKDKDAIEKIDAGLYKGLSVGFQSTKEKENDDVTLLTHCTDVYELSFVTVPAVPKALINIKTLKLKGVNTMKFKDFTIKKLLANHPDLKSVSTETLDDILKSSEDVDVTEQDIQDMLDENVKLKEQIAELEKQLKEYENVQTKSDDESLVLSEAEKAVDELEPTEDAKDCIMDEVKEAFDNEDITVEKNEDVKTVKGLDKFIEKTKIKYTKLKMLGASKEVEKQEVQNKETKNLNFTADNKNEKSVAKEEVVIVKKGFKN